MHAKDAAGNWGADGGRRRWSWTRSCPPLTGVTVTPNPTLGAPLGDPDRDGDRRAEPRSTAAEWFVGTDPGIGKATAVHRSAGHRPGVRLTATHRHEHHRRRATTPLRVRVRDAGRQLEPLRTRPSTVHAPLFFSTPGNTNPPGVGGTADDADIYAWSGSAHSRALDLSGRRTTCRAAPTWTASTRVDATHFYVSFAGNVTVPGTRGGAGRGRRLLQHRHLVACTSTAPRTGSAAPSTRTPSTRQRAATLYFSTVGNTNPPGAGGAADDADVYSWNARHGILHPGVRRHRPLAACRPAPTWTASSVVDATHLYLSFAPDTTRARRWARSRTRTSSTASGSTWSIYFDGTAHGLTSDATSTSTPSMSPAPRPRHAPRSAGLRAFPPEER